MAKLAHNAIHQRVTSLALSLQHFISNELYTRASTHAPSPPRPSSGNSVSSLAYDQPLAGLSLRMALPLQPLGRGLFLVDLGMRARYRSISYGRSEAASEVPEGNRKVTFSPNIKKLSCSAIIRYWAAN